MVNAFLQNCQYDINLPEIVTRKEKAITQFIVKGIA